MMNRRGWKHELLRLSHVERDSQWQQGDLYREGRKLFGSEWCRATVEASNWRGNRYSTLKTYASIARTYSPEFRRLNLSFSHHQQAASLPIDVRFALLDQAAREGWNENRMRIECRRVRHWQPLLGNDVVDDLATLIAQGKKFHTILADPPWSWERAGGKTGSSTSYYPVMSLDELRVLPVSEVASDDAFLFLWCPPAGLAEHGLPLLSSWGFTYKTCSCWDKLTGDFGVGSYWRMAHELLLLGVRPNSPTHFIDDSLSSMIRIKRSRNHSEKPPEVHRLIERATSAPYLELFARRRVDGWSCFGNQLAPIDSQHQLLAAD
jgi:N6-adenosine-specific RNA methylase IME4